MLYELFAVNYAGVTLKTIEYNFTTVVFDLIVVTGPVLFPNIFIYPHCIVDVLLF